MRRLNAQMNFRDDGALDFKIEQDHSKALIENVLDLTPVVDLGPVRHPSSITKRV
jgi:hypothetical protein